MTAKGSRDVAPVPGGRGSPWSPTHAGMGARGALMSCADCARGAAAKISRDVQTRCAGQVCIPKLVSRSEPPRLKETLFPSLSTWPYGKSLFPHRIPRPPPLWESTVRSCSSLWAPGGGLPKADPMTGAETGGTGLRTPSSQTHIHMRGHTQSAHITTIASTAGPSLRGLIRACAVGTVGHQPFQQVNQQLLAWQGLPGSEQNRGWGGVNGWESV